MNDLEKAARQALEALSRSKLMDDNHFYCYAAATALSQALEQAEKKPCNPSCAPGYCYCKEMTEQPKQKPVAWWNPRKDTVSCDPVHRHHPDCVPLYTEPPKHKEGCAECGKLPSDGWALYCVKCSEPMREWVKLTDEAIWLEYQRFWPFHPTEEPTLAKDIAKFARSIEAKLKELNT